MREVKIKVVRNEAGTEPGKLALYGYKVGSNIIEYDFMVSTRLNAVKRLSCMPSYSIDSEFGEKNYGSTYSLLG